MKRTVIGLLAAAAVIVAPGIAIAHNAGHVFLPDGTCLDVGAGNEAPLVGKDRVPLDLVPSTARDEFGVSFVGYYGQTPLFPGVCPAISQAAAAAAPDDATGTTIVHRAGLW